MAGHHLLRAAAAIIAGASTGCSLRIAISAASANAGRVHPRSKGPDHNRSWARVQISHIGARKCSLVAGDSCRQNFGFLRLELLR